MVTRTATSEGRRRFTEKERQAMTKAGILARNGGVELRDGELFRRQDGTRLRFTADEYYKLAEVGKHLLAEITGAPDGDTLEALRNAGVAGLVIGLSAGEETINGLKESLLDMPRPGSDSRSRSNAILPGSVYADRRPAPAEPDPDDDD